MDMDVTKLMEEYATEINGQYSAYDDNRSVVIVPLPDGRFQSVRGGKLQNKRYKKPVIQLLSRVCRTTEKINYTELLEHNGDSIDTRFVVIGDFLLVETTVLAELVTPVLLKELIMATAMLADQWEHKITGKDIH